MKKLFVLAALMTGACAAPMFGGAGSTVALISSTPASVTYEYTRWYGSELQVAANNAQAYCRQYGKNAQTVATNPSGWNTADRVSTTFNCVAP